MQVESSLSKTIITGIKETPKKRACAGLGMRTQMLPWSRGAAGARLRSALWDAAMVPVGQLGHCRGIQWGSIGFQWGSSNLPGMLASPAPGESAAQAAAHSLLSSPTGQAGISEQVWKAEELSAKACAGAFPCRSWSSRWQTGPTT